MLQKDVKAGGGITLSPRALLWRADGASLADAGRQMSGNWPINTGKRVGKCAFPTRPRHERHARGHKYVKSG
jgi:hypothetical protein